MEIELLLISDLQQIVSLEQSSASVTLAQNLTWHVTVTIVDLGSHTLEFPIILSHISTTCPICVRGFVMFSPCLFPLKHLLTLNTHDKMEFS